MPFTKGHTVNNGRTPWNKGIPRTQEVKDAISRANKGKLIGEKNPLWKGELVLEAALHSWLKRQLGKAKKCEFCGSKKTVDWANKSHQYKRELDDWLQLCRSCHAKFDKFRVGEKHYERKELFQKRRELQK